MAVMGADFPILESPLLPKNCSSRPRLPIESSQNSSTGYNILEILRERAILRPDRCYSTETPPGPRMQLDFDEERVSGADEQVRISVFVAVLGYSRRTSAAAFRHARRQARFDGMEATFHDFGRQSWNRRSVAKPQNRPKRAKADTILHVALRACPAGGILPALLNDGSATTRHR